MWIDIGLAVAAAIVAIFGTVTNQGPKIKGLLVVLAILIGLGAILKSFKDETEKQFVREAITEGLNPGPEVLGKIVDEMDRIADTKGYHVDHTSIGGGIVFYLLRPQDVTDNAGKDKTNNIGIIVLDQLDLAKIYSKFISNGDYDTILLDSFDKKYNFTAFSEDLYSRLCVLLSASVRNLLYKPPVSCDYDSDAGITVTANVRGIERQLTFPPNKIVPKGNRDAKIPFHEIDADFRALVTAAQTAKPTAD